MVFKSACTNLYSRHQSIRILALHILTNTCRFFVVFKLANLVGMWWYHIEVLICILLASKEVKYFSYIYWTFKNTYLYLLSMFLLFSSLVIYNYLLKNFLFTLDTNPLLDICIANIFLLCGLPLTLLIVPS